MNDIQVAEARQEITECDAVLAYVQTAQVTDQASLDTFGGIAKEAKARTKVLDTKLKEFTAPLRQAEANARAWFKPRQEKYAQVESVCKAKIGTYHLAQQREQILALNAAAAQFQAGNQQAGVTALAVVPDGPNVSKGVGVRTVEKFRVVNPDLVPREACSPDPDKIKAIRALGHDVPGVEFYIDTQVSVRSK
jgi:hypothetical protein